MELKTKKFVKIFIVIFLITLFFSLIIFFVNFNYNSKSRKIYKIFSESNNIEKIELIGYDRIKNEDIIINTITDDVIINKFWEIIIDSIGKSKKEAKLYNICFESKFIMNNGKIIKIDFSKDYNNKEVFISFYGGILSIELTCNDKALFIDKVYKDNYKE